MGMKFGIEHYKQCDEIYLNGWKALWADLGPTKNDRKDKQSTFSKDMLVYKAILKKFGKDI